MNNTYQFDVAIIGAGIIGLAIAENLSHLYERILIVDKEKKFGQHTSSRNSEVIHSGIYYAPGSFKAALCLKGNKLLYQFLEKYDLPYKKCGKLIVANENNIDELYKLYNNGRINGVEGLAIIEKEKIQKLEPLIKSQMAILVPSTGVVDSHELMRKLEYLAKQNNVIISYNNEVKEIDKKDNNYVLKFKQEDYIIKSKIIINAAGLWSDKISELVGIEEEDYIIKYCKGEYFKTNRYKNMNFLVYPLPDSYSLGIHTKLSLDGAISFGPNAYFVDEINYKMDDKNKHKFINSIQQYMDIEEEDLYEDYTGIRPKLLNKMDFIIKNEHERGYKNFINLIGIESPGLTSCLAIADYIREIIQ